MKVEMACERYKKGLKDGEGGFDDPLVYFLDGSIASPFLQAMILIF